MKRLSMFLIIILFFILRTHDIVPAAATEIKSLQQMCIEFIVEHRLAGSELIPKYIGEDVKRADDQYRAQYREDMRALRTRVLNAIEDLSELENFTVLRTLLLCNKDHEEYITQRSTDVEKELCELIQSHTKFGGNITCMQRQFLPFNRSRSCTVLRCLSISFPLTGAVVCPILSLFQVLLCCFLPQGNSLSDLTDMLKCLGILGTSGTAVGLLGKRNLPIVCAQKCYRCLLPDEIDLPPLVPVMTEDFPQEQYQEQYEEEIFNDSSGDDEAPLLG